jgi:nucleoid DNA-binding protein
VTTAVPKAGSSFLFLEFLLVVDLVGSGEKGELNSFGDFFERERENRSGESRNDF